MKNNNSDKPDAEKEIKITFISKKLIYSWLISILIDFSVF